MLFHVILKQAKAWMFDCDNTISLKTKCDQHEMEVGISYLSKTFLTTQTFAWFGPNSRRPRQAG